MELWGAFWIGVHLLPYALCISVVAMILLQIVYRKTTLKLFFKTILCNVYFIGVLNVTGITYHFRSVEEILAGNYRPPNLILFRYLTTWDMLLNIIMMIPLGFILMEGKRIHFLSALGIGAVITCCIESMQFMQGRCFDINDIFFNIVGTFIGIVIHAIYRGVRKPS